ncbi:MAG TPA: hypothetical protein VK939_16310 [Longimicrobiales bacterium]|nr:hypothetical protein [Longimicrobiales bacterium]
MASTVATIPDPAQEGTLHATWWAQASRLTPVLLQLGLAGLVIWHFRLESRGVFKIFALGVIAFPVHALLPLRYRMAFFTAVSFAGIGLIFGLHDGAWLVSVGLILILACHLPVPFAARIAILLVLAAGVAFARTGVLILPVSAAVWPILASMFMFRLALYLHALRDDAAAAAPARTLAYFFMLPNVCYPLYPVVDYSAFGRTHYDAPAPVIYQRGASWIVRGLVHLLIYRFIYLHLTLDPARVATLGDLLQFMLTTFMLYLRVSGQFHLIVGLLHLFGFHLPETHRLYFLASSFTDLWRRINIYWKDYMMKLVFYPSFFRLRRHGDRFALVGATIVVFAATWMLHSYQWFWLRGSFPITVQDALFWTVLGALVIENSLRERRQRQRRWQPAARGWDGGRALRTLGVFATMCVIWSMWSAESVTEWLTLWSAAGNVDRTGLLVLAGVIGGGLLIAGRTWDPPVVVTASDRPETGRLATRGVVLLLALLLIGQPAVAAQGGERFAALVATLRSVALNQRDTALQHQGYYEGLDNRGRLSAELWNAYGNTPADWVPIQDTEVYRQRSDFLLADLRPGMRDVSVKGAPFSTNSWGMRDREYPLAKPPGTLRIAVLGPSHTAGSGVPDGAAFDVPLEAELNRQGPAGTRYEVLNFSVPTYSFVQQVAYLELLVRDFEPDVVLLTATGTTYFDPPIMRHLMTVLKRAIPIPYPELQQIITRAGIHEGDVGHDGVAVPFEWLRTLLRRVGAQVRIPDRELQQRLESVTGEVTRWALERSARVITEMRAAPVLMVVDLVGMERDPAPVLTEAAQAGFAVLDLRDVYAGHDPGALQLGDWDNHPNARAHELIAQRLSGELRPYLAALPGPQPSGD